MITLTVDRPFTDPYRYYDKDGNCYLLFTPRELWTFLANKRREAAIAKRDSQQVVSV